MCANVGAAWRMCHLLKTKLSILAVTVALRQTACYLPLKFKIMTEFEVKAKELVNEIYQPLGYLRCMVSNDEMWNWAKDRVREQIKIIKAQIPMYTGNLNPKWKYWDEVEKAVDVIP